MNSSGIIISNTLGIKINFFLKFILVFFLLYDINFNFMPSVTTGRLSFLLLLLVSVPRKIQIPKKTLYFLICLLFIILTAIVQFFFSNDPTQVSRLIWFIIYGVITPFLLIKHLRNINEFLWLILFAVVLQSVLAIFSFINPQVKSLFYNLIIFTSNYDEELTLRATGFSSIGGAGLSVIQSLGFISGLLLLRDNFFSVFKNITIWVFLSIVLVSTLIIGRTGLFICLFCLALYFLTIGFKIKNLVVIAVSMLLLTQIDFARLVENSTSGVRGFDTNLFITWIESAFVVENNTTTEVLEGMPIPPLSLNTIIGTGRVVDESGVGNASGHDSGYIQTYYSLGLLITILFYISYLFFLSTEILKKGKLVLFILISIMFTIEVKEPFIFQYVFPFFTLCLILIINRDEVMTKMYNKEEQKFKVN